jgi:hypothetical protein
MDSEASPSPAIVNKLQLQTGRGPITVGSAIHGGSGFLVTLSMYSFTIMKLEAVVKLAAKA